MGYLARLCVFWSYHHAQPSTNCRSLLLKLMQTEIDQQRQVIGAIVKGDTLFVTTRAQRVSLPIAAHRTETNICHLSVEFGRVHVVLL